MQLNTIGINEKTIGYQADKNCLDWCVPQHVINYNNMETYNLWFVASAMICIFCAEYFIYKNNIKVASFFIYVSKISIYIFFFVYFVILKLRLYYYATGG